MINLVPVTSYLTCLILLLVSFLITTINSIIIVEWEIYHVLSTTIKLDLIIEWKSILYSSTVIFISGRVLKFSKIYIKEDPNKLRFTYTVLLFILSINLLIYIPSLLCILIGWDGLGITSFILVTYYNNRRSLGAGIITIITNRLGDVFLLIAIISTLHRRDWLIQNKPIENITIFQSIGILIAAITKRAQVPYSRWLPAAMAAPTPVSALVHSSTLVTAGIFLLCRFHNIILIHKPIQLALIIRGISTTLLAGIRGIYENDIKKIIALSTLSQLGIITTCLGAKLHELAYFHIVTHAIFKALLFIAAGCLISINNHNQDLRLYGKYLYISPITRSTIIIASIALIGLPFMAGYYSKHSIINRSLVTHINYALYILIILAILLTSIYTIRLILFTIIRPPAQQPLYGLSSTNNTHTPLILISLISTVAGRIIQWMLPLTPTTIRINDNLELTTINLIIIIGMGLIIAKTRTTSTKPTYQLTNKLYTSIGFLTPTSTQFPLPMLISISIKLYKNLDQAWLEKTGALGISNLINNLGIKLSLSTLIKPQQRLLLNRLSRSILITITTIITLF